MNNSDLFTEIADFIGFQLYFCIGILREGDRFGEERQLRIGRTHGAEEAGADGTGTGGSAGSPFTVERYVLSGTGRKKDAF